MKTKYPFTKHIPIVSSHFNVCAMRDLESQREENTCFYQLCGFPPGMEREQAVLDLRAAPGRAMTGNGDNDTPAQSHAMGAARRDPRRGEIPVELVCRQPFGDFLLVIRGVEDK